MSKISTIEVLREQFFALSDKERLDFHNLSIVKQTQDINEYGMSPKQFIYAFPVEYMG